MDVIASAFLLCMLYSETGDNLRSIVRKILSRTAPDLRRLTALPAAARVAGLKD
jgi:hypothetical protein